MSAAATTRIIDPQPRAVKPEESPSERSRIPAGCPALDDDGVAEDALGAEEHRRREPIIDSCSGCHRVEELVDALGRCFACGPASKSAFRENGGP